MLSITLENGHEWWISTTSWEQLCTTATREGLLPASLAHWQEVALANGGFDLRTEPPEIAAILSHALRQAAKLEHARASEPAMVAYWAGLLNPPATSITTYEHTGITMHIKFENNRLTIGERTIELSWPILDVKVQKSGLFRTFRIFVLLDPDSYINAEYNQQRRGGASAIKNLLAFASDGTKLWEAEFPKESDYYYAITLDTSLKAYSYSSYLCVIDQRTGKIKTKTFFK